MSSLWGAADDGSGNAALPSRRLPDRFPRRVRNLFGASAAGAVVAIVAAQIVFGSPAKQESFYPDEGMVDVSLLPSSPAPTPMSSLDPGGSLGSPADLSEYAVAVTELQGLPPDVQPGQSFDLWVAWDPVVSDGPQIQRLLKQVRIARFIEPTTFEGPMVAVLSVPTRRVGDLMYGDRFGSFNVTLAPTGG